MNKWDENESRFEPQELKWVANYIVNNLVFCRGLYLDDQASAAVMHLLWEVLDILNGVSADID